MEIWRKAWREGIAPLLEERSLRRLRQACQDDDPRLVQGTTTVPPPLQAVEDWPCEAACALGMCGLGLDLKTVGEVEEYFAGLCWRIDQRLGEPAGCRWFLNWFDETPRAEMRAALLAEIDLEFARRAA